ncbi:MAG: hypothetical protein SGPRY_003048 [Prymnesium sp.]
MQVLRPSRSSHSQVANVKPTVGVLNSLIDACSQAQMLVRDQGEFEYLPGDFLQAGERLECSVFNAVSLLTSVHSILLPTSFPTYLLYLLNLGQVMKLCGEMGNMECATRVFELMLQALIAPNSFTYSAFIEACVNGKNSTRALQALFSLFPLLSPASSHVLNEMASGGWTAEASSLESIVLSTWQVETGLCSSEVYQLLCDVAKRAESPGEGESSIIEAISKLQQLSPSTEPPAEKTHHSIHMLQTYLRLRQKQSVALGNPIQCA